jgi:hypothetical protein
MWQNFVGYRPIVGFLVVEMAFYEDFPSWVYLTSLVVFVSKPLLFLKQLKLNAKFRVWG